MLAVVRMGDSDFPAVGTLDHLSQSRHLPVLLDHGSGGSSLSSAGSSAPQARQCGRSIRFRFPQWGHVVRNSAGTLTAVTTAIVVTIIIR